MRSRTPVSTRVRVVSSEPYVHRIAIGSESEAFSKWCGTLAGTNVVSKVSSSLRSPSMSTIARPTMTTTDSGTLWVWCAIEVPGSKRVVPLRNAVPPRAAVTSGIVRQPPPRSMTGSSFGRKMRGVWEMSGMVGLLDAGIARTRAIYRPTRPIMAWLYRSPDTPTRAAREFRSATSSALRPTVVAPAFSSRRSRRRVPGIGTIHGC